MKIENIMDILNNKRYATLSLNGIEYLEWIDIELYNGDMIKIEYFSLFDEDEYKVSYFVSEQDRAVNVWVGEYDTNAYYIFSNIYKETKRYYEAMIKKYGEVR